MGRSQSKIAKSTTSESNQKTPLSPRLKAKHRKFGFFRKNKKSKLEKLKVPRHSLKICENDETEMEVKLHMQEQLAFNSDIWVLNQMMMSVQFFANYERDLVEAVELNRKRENQKSKCLAKHCKNVILPDRLHEAVDRRVKYVAKHGKLKNQLLPIHKQTLYIVHDNIEITNPGESSVYCTVTNAPLYKLQIDNPFEGTRKKKILYHVGYVKLKTSEKITKNDVMNYSPSSDSQYVSESLKNEEDESEYDVNSDGFFRGKLRDSIRCQKSMETPIDDRTYYTSSISTTSTSPGSSVFDYTYITALHTHQPLGIMKRNGVPLSTVMLPDKCITNVSRFMVNNRKQESFYGVGYNSDDETDSHQDNDEQSDFDSRKDSNFYYEDKQYLNSKEFLSHFISLFQESLAENLGISKDKLENATWKGSSVYCAPWEVIPAFSCAWPQEANEWVFRQRESRIDPLTKQIVQWPTTEMINKITNLGCHVIPMGFAPKTGTNPQRDLEWKIVFPEAERYLESQLTSAQAKVYIITKALLKTFTEPSNENSVNMFTSEHLRSHLFWQCEHNYVAWPEDRLGETLLKFLCSLLHCIKIHRLPDYFLPKRNLIENIPEKVLVDLHKRIYRIVESPVPYLLIVLRNLRYQRDFYPKLKGKRLYSRLISKSLIKSEETGNNVDIIAPSDDEDAEYALGSIGYYDRNERKSKRRKKRCVRFALDEHYVAAYSRRKDVDRHFRKASIESIDVKATFMKHMETDRRKLVYEVFIQQFIAMARVSIKYRAFQQTMILLKQAQRICSLLIDDHFENEAESYDSMIETLSSNLIQLSISDGPELPRRLSESEREIMRTRQNKAITIETDISSDDDNDEIYNYHQSVIAQINITSTENLARFHHTDENDDDDVDEMTENLDQIEIYDENTIDAPMTQL